MPGITDSRRFRRLSVSWLPRLDNQTKPNLLLLDLKMPLVDGFDVLLWLRARPELITLPVVVLSSSILPADKMKAKELGAKDYHVKPTDVEELTKLAHTLHEPWLKETKT